MHASDPPDPAQVKQPHKLNQAATQAEILSLCSDSYATAVRYAHVFSESDGRGAEDAAAYAALVDAMGEGRAASVRALCWFLYWGSITGNTLNSALGYTAPKPGYDSWFLALFFAYYALLFFGLINLVSFLLKAPLSPPPPCCPRTARRFGAQSRRSVLRTCERGTAMMPPPLQPFPPSREDDASVLDRPSHACPTLS